MHAVQTIQTEHKLVLKDVLGWLVNDGIASLSQTKQLKLVKNLDDSTDRHPLISIAQQSWQSATKPSYSLTADRLTQWLANRHNLPYLYIDPLKLDVDAITKLVPQAYAARFQILPVNVDAQQVTFATAEPFLREWEAELAPVLGREIRRVIANPADIAKYLSQFYSVSRSIHGAAQNNATANPLDINNFEQLTELGKIDEPDANDKHIVHVVDWLLQYAFEQRASDIHIEPRRTKSTIRFRIDGVLHLVHELPTPVITAVTSRLKSLGRMDVAEKRRPQDGRIKTRSPIGKEIEMRLSTMPTAFGEKLVLRIFDPEVFNKNFSELGFSRHDMSLWQPMVDNPHGIVLVTGPTGSGKTSTLYAALKHLARPEINICTIEDPIEMVEPQFNQMQVQASINLDFASGVRTLLRQDPDVIMIGEIRDKETAEVAIQAALTGHLVLSTLHTNDAPAAITRLMDIGVQPYLIRSTLLGVLAQRLVRTLCPDCKVKTSIAADAWAGLIHPYRSAPPANTYKPAGCNTCRQSGYLGRIGLYEILPMLAGVREQITSVTDATALRAAAEKCGMRHLRLSGAAKIAAGLTTLDEIYRVVPAGD